MRDVQSSALRMLHAYGIPADIVEEYDCVPIRIRRVGESVRLQTMFGARSIKTVLGNGEQVRYAFEVAERLAIKGYRNVPRFIRNRYGDAYIRDGKRFYYMTDWLSGRSLDAAQVERIQGAMSELVEWQLAAKGIIADSSLPRIQRPFAATLQVLHDNAQNFWEQMRVRPERTEFERLFAGFAKEILVKAQQVIQDLEALAWSEFETGLVNEGWLCYGHFYADNVRFDGESYALIDYEHIHYGCPMTDLVDFCGRHLQMHQWRVDVTRDVIDAYMKKISEPNWYPYLWPLLSAPLEVLRLVEQYQSQEYRDEGLYADALEQALQQETVKEQTILALRKELHEQSELAEDEVTAVESMDVVHADLRQEPSSVEVGAEIAKLDNGPQRKGVRSRQMTQMSLQKKSELHTDVLEEPLRIRKYRPKPSRQGSKQTNASPEKDHVKLWGDVHDPQD